MIPSVIALTQGRATSGSLDRRSRVGCWHRSRKRAAPQRGVPRFVVPGCRTQHSRAPRDEAADRLSRPGAKRATPLRWFRVSAAQEKIGPDVAGWDEGGVEPRASKPAEEVADSAGISGSSREPTVKDWLPHRANIQAASFSGDQQRDDQTNLTLVVGQDRRCHRLVTTPPLLPPASKSSHGKTICA